MKLCSQRRSGRGPSAATARRGFTLLEMVIVLAILVVVVGLGWPALRGSLQKSRLHDAAKQVRIELARARVEAIESGSPCQFRYEEGGERFEITGSVVSDEAAQRAWEDMHQPPASLANEFRLPEGVTFAPPETADEVEPVPLQDGIPAEGQWSAPVVFYPNGRSSNVRIRLQIAEGLFVDLTVRGMTGTAKVGRIQRQEVPP